MLGEEGDDPVTEAQEERDPSRPCCRERTGEFRKGIQLVGGVLMTFLIGWWEKKR